MSATGTRQDDSPARERHEQKARTREALLAGARALLERGVPLTVTAAAAEAGISKATAYRYFKDPQILGLEAGLAVEVQSYARITRGATTPRDRVRAISRYFLDLALAHEPAFRQFLARTLDAWVAENGAPRTRRGGRRIAMFQEALAETDLSPAARELLVLGLTTATGTEAMVALLDIAGATPETAREVIDDMTLALLDRHGVP